MIKKILILVQLLRVKQWIKNFFIFFPLIFSGQFYDFDFLLRTIITFAAFCFVTSGIYVFNDCLDIKRDRAHPRKKDRPLASLNICPWAAAVTILSLVAAGLFCARLVDSQVVMMALVYVGLNVIYNLFAKRVVILDVIFIALGFQIRVWAGSLAIGILPSVWLQLCVFLLSLFLGFSKRRNEIAVLKDKASEHRVVLSHYNLYLLDQIIAICSTLTIVFYGLYAMSTAPQGPDYMVYSIIFVIYGIFRYLYLIHVKKLCVDASEIIFSDFPFFINILCWTFYIVFILYF